MTTAKRSSVQLQQRVPETLPAELDAWVEEINKRRISPLTRSDVVRIVLTWAAHARPDVDELNKEAVK